ncbi:MAG: hypothetical protein R2764_07120 [Bacteroidales bacterium]
MKKTLSVLLLVSPNKWTKIRMRAVLSNLCKKKVKEGVSCYSVDRYDERFTSKMAFQTLIDAGIGKKARQNKSIIDKISAF